MIDDVESKGKRLVRPTLSAVLNAQEQLRKHIAELRDESRSLTDEKERIRFIKEWNYSTLGFGKDFEVSFHVRRDGWPKRFGTDYFARYLSMQTRDVIIYNESPSYGGEKIEYKVPISRLWDILLQGAFKIFPHAIERATSMSKEQETTQRTKGYSVK